MTNSMDCIFVKINNKVITLKEFLTIDSTLLSKSEHKIQEALSYLYKKNKKKPPLFKEFPDRGEKKLTIDCTTIPMDKWVAAQYEDEENKIEFSSTSKITNLIVTLAHELKHAEQTSEELLSMQKNNLQTQQLNFFCEIQAFAFENYIASLMHKDRKKNLTFNEKCEEKDTQADDDLGYSEGLSELKKSNHEVPDLDNTLQKILQKHLKKEKFDYSEYEKEAISTVLPILYTGMDNYNYRAEYDEDNPIQCHENKKLNYLPYSFNLSAESQKTFLKILNRIPPTDLTKYSKNAMWRYFLYKTAIGDFATVDELLKSNYFNFDLNEEQKKYIVDMMIDHQAEEYLHILTDGWDKDKVSKIKSLIRKNKRNSMKKRLASLRLEKDSSHEPRLIASHRRKNISDSSRKKE